jgi:uncharacterized protein with GYD domain
MANFFLFGKYSHEAIKGLSNERTKKAVELIGKFNGKVISMYALLGANDLLLQVDFPDAENVMKASLAISKLTGIGFSTSQAIPVEDFDSLIAEV